MGILDWFKNRAAQFDADGVSEDTVQRAAEKAIALTNPRLRVLPDCHSRLIPAVRRTVIFLTEVLRGLPPARPISAAAWSSDAALRAFFVAPSDIPAMLGRSQNLRTVFAKFPELDAAYLVLGMALNEQRSLGIALQGTIVQRDVVQTSISFSDHRAHLCSRDESRLHRLVGAQAYEFLLAEALSEIGEDRVERQELEANRALIGARLRLLRQQGPGLGSMFDAGLPGNSEQATLEAKLVENEQQLAAIGGGESALEAELDCLIQVLDNPQRYLRVEQRELRLNTMNVVVGADDSGPVADVRFSLAELAGSSPRRRAFVLFHVARSELPTVQGIDFDLAARCL
ncbi:MAG TPA: hypothetical protein PKA30_12690 [Accumulibacter sp.]|uniref:hypothetical protein n=1 Tax=Accumulibacter sp. TaxID=2053492 RepID=UPI00287A5660|nr:hypothetical protein [Accumulibacter sp.]HNI00354.1 hypothetical protein [Rhodocyclaceae bacterium]MDS4053934.1 hypothetical protein [Accumulibacter sp.]HMV06393.1 hypothetical protein [Accumulibacter sp.]HMW64734.1 hypothetical protein [Accumulibacter sp.]HMW81806.1 hypothetical protein [Accumulibacter sp.]